MSGPLTYRRGLFGGGGTSFHPTDIDGYKYFDETERTFSSSGDAVNTGIYNGPFNDAYAHVWIKFSLDDGQPAATSYFFGARTGATNDFLYFYYDSAGKIRFVRRAGAVSTDPYFANGAISKRTLRVSITSGGTTADVYENGTFAVTLTSLSTAMVAQTSIPIYYGAFNNNGTISSPMGGTGYGLFIWSGATDLTEQNISDIDNYFAAL